MGTDGVRNGRTYDDKTWLHIDTSLPHSGRYSGRVFIPEEGSPAFLAVPCQRGGETGTTAKQNPVCKMGNVNLLNSTTYTVSLFARALHPGARVEIWYGMLETSSGVGSDRLVSRVELGNTWTHVVGNISASNWVPGFVLLIRLEVQRAGSVWIDDVSVSVNASQALTAETLVV